jgi:hypothetical protein
MELEIRAFPKNKKVERLLKEWPERLEAINQVLPMNVADDILRFVQKQAPRGIAGYPEMLKVRRLPDREDWTIMGILPPGWAFAQRLRTVDAKITVLYVRPRTRAGEAVSQAAVVLSRENPWTMDTLPYEPTRQEASIVSRQVTPREAREIETYRRRDRHRVVQELRDLGVTNLRPEGKITLSRKVSRDLLFEIVRHEFGIPPIKGRAHWRPILRRVPQSLGLAEFRKLYRWFAFPEEQRWRSIRALPVERASVIKRVQRFQDLMAPKRA